MNSKSKKFSKPKTSTSGVESPCKSTAYKSTQALGKAVKKASNALPVSPTKKKAVLIKLIGELSKDDQHEIISVIAPKKFCKNKSHKSSLVIDIEEFFNRDDISRISPKARDTKEYVDPNTGEKTLLPMRHMLLTIKEAYAIFCEERQQEVKYICCLSIFTNNKPENIKFIRDLPHDMCLCHYHANFIEAVTALNTFVPLMPTYENNFVGQFLCQHSTPECWLSTCRSCNGISEDRLRTFVGNADLTMPVKWMLWEKNDKTKRTEKHEKSGALNDLVCYIGHIAPQFLKHSFVKREQSDVFSKIDRLRSKNEDIVNEIVIQIDFAENYVCEAQDEVQNAHWNQRQLSLFTTASFHQNKINSKIFVSNSTNHTKDTIVAYVYKLLVKILKIWSDGPSSQFKNKYIAAMIMVLEKRFGLTIFWNYFAASHGKGCVDGIGATAKTFVRKQVLARKFQVNSAKDFKEAFQANATTIAIEEVTEEQFEGINVELESKKVYQSAKTITNIASSHHLQVHNQNIVPFLTSRLGYENAELY